MPTIIELHIITYFSIMLFAMLIIKMFLKTKANIFLLIFASLMFAIIKFVLDVYVINLCLQLAIMFVYFALATIAVHKLNHISKLIIAIFIFFVYYICLVGINWIICSALQKDVYYISNFYLFMVLGLNFLIFSIFILIISYLRAENPLKLTRECQIVINNIKIPLTGFVDTGNCLKDDKLGKSVVVVSINAISDFITPQMYADLIFASNSSGAFPRIKKIMFQTISGENSISVFLPNKFMVEGKAVDCLVGITLKKMEYDVLLNQNCI